MTTCTSPKALKFDAELAAFIASAASWSSFAASLQDALNRYGGLTDKQVVAAHNMMEKENQKKEGKKERRNLIFHPLERCLNMQ